MKAIEWNPSTRDPHVTGIRYLPDVFFLSQKLCRTFSLFLTSVNRNPKVSADYSQENEALIGENAGKQRVAMSFTAIIYQQIEHISNWASSTLNNILTIGNNLYISIRYSVQANDYLLLTDVPCIVSLYNKVYTLQYSESLTGSLFVM